ncbi:MAG: ABC transporter ATP-binding protein [Bacilli bacterium]
MSLKLEEVGVAYGGVQIIQGVSLCLEKQRCTALIGPNGAGKTTLLNAVSGHARLNSGRLVCDGVDVSTWTPDRRARSGIGRSFQGIHLFPHLSAVDNVALAVSARQGTSWKKLFAGVPGEWKTEACVQLSEVCLEHHAQTQAQDLSHGDKRKLELAMLLALQPNYLLLDEPTAGMALAEVPMMLSILEHLKESGRYSLLLVEHKLDAVFRLSDEIVVLQQGSVLASGSPDDILRNEAVQAAYLGGTYGNPA